VLPLEHRKAARVGDPYPDAPLVYHQLTTVIPHTVPGPSDADAINRKPGKFPLQYENININVNINVPEGEKRGMTIEILKSMAKENQVFSFDQLYQKTQISKGMLRVILFRLEEKGFIERIDKGKYLIIPLGSEKGKYTLHEFIIGSYLVEPYAISYWSALHYYGLTEQIPATVFIQTPARKNKSAMEIFGVNYRIVRVKEEKFFGIRKEWIEETPVSIADKEKTIIDCLDKLQYSGGIVEVTKALKSSSLDRDRLADYAIRIGNFAVVRRLGYLCEKMGVHINLPLPRSKKYLLLDPTMPAEGKNDPKWRLVINHDAGLPESLE